MAHTPLSSNKFTLPLSPFTFRPQNWFKSITWHFKPSILDFIGMFVLQLLADGRRKDLSALCSLLQWWPHNDIIYQLTSSTRHRMPLTNLVSGRELQTVEPLVEFHHQSSSSACEDSAADTELWRGPPEDYHCSLALTTPPALNCPTSSSQSDATAEFAALLNTAKHHSAGSL